jgi:hypothetical protein
MRPMRKIFAALADTRRAAALLEREELLLEQARHLDEASYRRRMEIEEELAEIRRLLKTLGLQNNDLN